MYKKLSRIGPISCGLFYALMALLFLIIYAIFVFIMLQMMPNAIPPEFRQIFASPEFTQFILYAVIGALVGGFIVGLLTAIIYNIVAMMTGGIKIKTTELGYDDI